MALLVLLLLAMAAFTQVENTATRADDNLARARINALFALDSAMAQLQSASGPDQRSTASARLFNTATANPRWTGVWDTTQAKPPVWLASCHKGVAPDTIIPDSQRVVVLDLTSGKTGETVAVHKLPLKATAVNGLQGEQTVGYYAWWVGDEGIKASLLPADGVDGVSELAVSRSPQIDRQQLLTQTNVGTIWPNVQDSSIYSLRANTRALGQVAFWPGVDGSSLNEHYFEYTLESRGLLTNPAEGGLKYNLSTLAAPLASDPWMNQSVVDFLKGAENYTPLSATETALKFLTPQSEGPIPLGTQGIPCLSIAPILTEFQLRIGIFHTQSDSLHRIRFHVEAELWNPYAHALKFQDESHDRALQITVDGLPSVVVTNEDSGSSFTADLSNFTPINAPNLRQIASWVALEETLLEPGEVYQLLEPPASQPQGLARTLTNTKWKWSASAKPSTAPNTIGPKSTVSIKSQSPSSVTIKITRFDEEIPDDETPREHAESVGSVIELRHVPFDPFALELDGDQYSRAKSLEYVAADYRFAYHLRLKDDPATLTALRTVVDPRLPVFDFALPEIRALFEIESDPVAAVANANPFPHDDAELFQDLSVNTHVGAHAAIRVFDLPNQPPVSVGVLQHLRQEDRPAFTLPENLPDRYFFTGLAPDASGYASTPLPNSRLRVVPGATPGNILSTDAAQSLEVTGAFNLNSDSVAAWTAVLSRDFPTWKNRNGFHALKNPVFTLPFSAGETADTILPDSELGMIANEDRLLTQGLRCLDSQGDEQVEKLASEIVAANRTAAILQGHPLSSVGQWMNAGVLETAIENAHINALIPPLSPAFIKPGDLLTPLLPFVSTRSDTFTIRAYGEVFNPVTERSEGRAWCEALVQRTIEYIDPVDTPSTAVANLTSDANQQHGRRYRVLQFRWLNGPAP
ncbi:MAG: hypothetical protein SFY80_02540 [Verrucomicrobiota bacterium]|nr:hypothetical protein [Verrucomicrobiota bacterium]